MKPIEPIIKKTYEAAVHLRGASEKQIKGALTTLATLVKENTSVIIKANRLDLQKQAPDNPRNDRLLLNEMRIQAIVNSIRAISRLPNPANKKILSQKLPNGLLLEKYSVPLGVVGAIYESRPNVTFDVAALCLRSQNACLLKGSNEAYETNKAALKLIAKALRDNDINPNCITLLPPDREAVHELLTATRYVDVLIPRGSDALIQYVRKNSLVPVIETGAGVCHLYVEQHANLKKAVNIAVNAKVSRPSVCNAIDTILVDEAIAQNYLEQLAPALQVHGVVLYADTKAYRLLKQYPHLQKAAVTDFGREFLSLQCAVKVVKGIDEALLHIRQYSTKHSEAIVSENKQHCKRFIQEVDAAAVYTNASTRFTDGEEFGLGAEIGISTQKLHARGPFALEKLVTEKWVVQGNGQVR
jgi:glutamate-5-semialdehyde dehydrogenase